MLRAVGALLHKERNIAITLSFCETRRKRAVQLAPNTASPRTMAADPGITQVLGYFEVS